MKKVVCSLLLVISFSMFSGQNDIMPRKMTQEEMAQIITSIAKASDVVTREIESDKEANPVKEMLEKMAEVKPAEELKARVYADFTAWGNF